MTAQIPDTVIYSALAPALASYREDGSERAWSIAGIAGGSLFDPAAQKLKVQSPHTGCWRGYHCDYLVRDGELLLTRVTCGLGRTDVLKIELGGGPRLFGTPLRPRLHLTQKYDPETGRLGPQEMTPAGDYQAEGLAVPVDFTGGLLLGRDLLRELYVHMGFQPAYKFQSVTELTFEHGHLRDAADHSDAVARYRSALGAWAERPARPWYARWFRPLPADARPPLPFAHRY